MTAYHSLVTRAATQWKVYRQAMATPGAEARRFWRSEVRWLVKALRRHLRGGV